MNVFGVLKDLKGLVFSKPDSTDVINLTFRLHRFTAVILITCSILISCKQFLGENIHCMLDGLEDAKDKKLIESFCFMKATFTLSRPEVNLKDLLKSLKNALIFAGSFPPRHSPWHWPRQPPL